MRDLLRVHFWIAVSVVAVQARERFDRDLERLHAYAMRRAYRMDWR